MWTRQTSHEVVAVSGWGDDGRDDGVCAGVSIISRIVAVNYLDLCSVAFAFENCNAFHTFKVPRFPPRATWSRVFQSRLFHPSNLVPPFPVLPFPVPRFQRPRSGSNPPRFQNWGMVTIGHFNHINWWEIFPPAPSTCPTSRLVTANALPVFALFRYGRATCQNRHVIYEAFATVSLWGWASHSYLFRWVLHFFRCSSVYTYCIVTGGESGTQSDPCDPTTVS